MTPMVDRIAISDSGCAVSLYEVMGIHLAVSELSIIPVDLVKEIYSEAEGTWVYFSRLFVPYKYPDKSVCFRLMKATTNWADEKKVSILDELSPYNSDRLNLDQLITFNKLYGFKHIRSNIMVRIHK